jgi:hypothetical protein
VRVALLDGAQDARDFAHGVSSRSGGNGEEGRSSQRVNPGWGGSLSRWSGCRAVVLRHGVSRG